MKSTAQFKNWLNDKIVWLQEFPTERRRESEHTEAAGLINEAFQHATDLRLADAAAACRPGRVDVRLLECLAAIPEPETEYYTPPEIAKLLGIDPSTVRGWIESRQLKASNLATAGRPKWMVQQDDLDLFLKSRQLEPLTKRKTVAKVESTYSRFSE